jgi:transcriptional regulator with PAS, ATPase and Fis domain
MPDLSHLKGRQSMTAESLFPTSFERPKQEHHTPAFSEFDDSRPILLTHKGQTAGFHDTEDVEEILSIEEMEKDMIKKALKKFNNRRKDAADELGISERTLYRKIKEYNIPD